MPLQKGEKLNLSQPHLGNAFIADSAEDNILSLSSPNQMVWRYFGALRRHVGALHCIEDEDQLKEDIAFCIMAAVAVVETFVNLLFRVVVSEHGFVQHEHHIIADLKNPRSSLEYKLRKWPARVFGKSIDFEASVPKAFLAIKERRNRLMHFTSSHQSIKIHGIEIHGLADTSVLDELSIADAVKALELAEGMICALLELRGVPHDQLGHALHAWTGKVPT